MAQRHTYRQNINTNKLINDLLKKLPSFSILNFCKVLVCVGTSPTETMEAVIRTLSSARMLLPQRYCLLFSPQEPTDVLRKEGAHRWERYPVSSAKNK